MGAAEVSKDEFCRLQQEDNTLKKYFEFAKTCQVDGKDTHFVMEDGVLCRVFHQKRGSVYYDHHQAVVPTSLRKQVMAVAHDSVFGGHMGTKKTKGKVTSHFYWPGVGTE